MAASTPSVASVPLSPLVLDLQSLERVGSAEACGDEPWFADAALCQNLIRTVKSLETSRMLLENAKNGLQKICSVLGSEATPEMLEQPYVPLLAAASRLLAAVLGLTGEGNPMDSQRGLRRRAVAAFTSCGIWTGCAREELLSKWYDEDELLRLFADTTMRHAFEIIDKRFRAQFVCMLFRTAAVEAVRNDGNLRELWPTILGKFPEVNVLQELKDRLLSRVWLANCSDDDSENDEPPEPELSTWAKFWRRLMAEVLPPAKMGGAAATDHELRCLTAELWKDFVEWFKKEYDDFQQHLDLFGADAKSTEKGSDRATWAFIPAMDLLLTVGDGMLTITAAGAATDSTNTQGRCAFSVAMKRATRPSKKRGLQRDSQPKAKKPKLNTAPTRVVLLTNMVGPGEVDEDLEQETAVECKKYGALKKCVVKEISDVPDNEAVRIFLEFAKVEGSSKAYSDLNGRFFGGRSVKARFFDEERFAKGDLGRFGQNATCTLFLTNFCSRADIDEEFESETSEEASKFGKVVRCIVTVLPDVADPRAVQVFIEFGSLAAAAKALTELTGRVYDGRELEVQYVADGTTSCEVKSRAASTKNSEALDQPLKKSATDESSREGSLLGKSPNTVDAPLDKTIAIDELLGQPAEKTSDGIGAADDDSDESSTIEHMRDSETGLWAL